MYVFYLVFFNLVKFLQSNLVKFLQSKFVKKHSNFEETFLEFIKEKKGTKRSDFFKKQIFVKA